MGYVIIDLEFNNMQNIKKYFPRIYERNTNLRTLEVQNEIIQIGAVKLDDKMNKIGEYKSYIKPYAFTVLNPIITDMTGITNNDLKTAISLKQGLKELRGFAGDNNVLCSWAKSDIAEIVINARYQKCDDAEIFWIKDYLDLQNYCTKLFSYEKAMGLKAALDELKIEVDNSKLHDALNDCDYTAEVLRKSYKEDLIKDYIVNNVYELPSIKIKDLRNYDPMDYTIEMKCQKCGGDLDITEPLTLLVTKFVSLVKCKDEMCNGRYLQEVILRKNISGKTIFDDEITTLDNYEYFNYSYKLKANKKKK